MEEMEFRVDGMSCQHCVRSVQQAVGSLPGVDTVEVDLQGGRVRVKVEAGGARREEVARAIEEEGYDVMD